MRIDVNTEVALVALEVQRASQDVHVASARLRIVSTSDVVLRGGVAVAKQRWGQLRHRVVLVGYAVVLALACAGDVVSEALQSDLRRAVSVQIDCGALTT